MFFNIGDVCDFQDHPLGEPIGQGALARLFVHGTLLLLLALGLAAAIALTQCVDQIIFQLGEEQAYLSDCLNSFGLPELSPSVTVSTNEAQNAPAGGRHV